MGDAGYLVRPVELTLQPPGTGAHRPAKGGLCVRDYLWQ
jgi:hypothetical protein